MNILKINKQGERRDLIIPFNSVNYISKHDGAYNLEIYFCNDRLMDVSFNVLKDYKECIKNIFKKDIELFVIDKYKNGSLNYICMKIEINENN